MYALNLAPDGRILSATYPQYAPADAVVVGSLPDGDVSDYRYVGGEYILDPLPKPERPEDEATLEGRVGELEEALNMLLSGVTE